MATIIEKDVYGTSYISEIALEKGVNYQFSIVAVNASGSGLSKTVSFFVDSGNFPKEYKAGILMFLDFVNGLITISDKTSKNFAESYEIDPNSLKGILRINYSGETLYKNKGWETDDFSLPDFDGGKDNWEFSGVGTPQNPISAIGEYDISYKLVYKDKDGNGKVLSFEYFFENLFSPNFPEINVDVFLTERKMIVADITKYNATFGSVLLPPDDSKMSNREIIIRPPITSLKQKIVSSKEIVEVNDVEDGNYDIELNNVVTYTPPTNSQQLEVKISYVYKGVTETNVVKDEFSINVLNCIQELIQYQKEIRTIKLAQAEEIKIKIDKLTYYYNMYYKAIIAGRNNGYSKRKLREIMKEVGCLF